MFDEIVTNMIRDMEVAANQAIKPSNTFQENVHLSLYEMLEFRMEHQLTIKLFQEERDIGTPIVQEVMQKVENTILQIIKKKLNEQLKKAKLKRVILN